MAAAYMAHMCHISRGENGGRFVTTTDMRVTKAAPNTDRPLLNKVPLDGPVAPKITAGNTHHKIAGMMADIRLLRGFFFGQLPLFRHLSVEPGRLRRVGAARSLTLTRVKRILFP
jgi:hypothetical protein